MKTTKVLFGILLLALLLLWLAGCGYRRTTIVVPDENGQKVVLGAERNGEPVIVHGRAVIVETYGVTSESAINAGNAADRQRLVAFCTKSLEHAKLEMCKTVGADRAPSDSPKEFGARRVIRARGTHYPNREFIQGSGVYWY